ncbi:hypothetical protein GUJ93_ZPchr0011g28457 [Zizania palustris]|uniref:Uncharacterized protein n=1 Tax=Zizania palustris TaxID=103762 RepID=A0A8J5WH95_ZIZPA|nr:hypothetical protein GUJ93_ZPchr0011g28457 [Zizania palustris]
MAAAPLVDVNGNDADEKTCDATVPSKTQGSGVLEYQWSADLEFWSGECRLLDRSRAPVALVSLMMAQPGGLGDGSTQ